MAARTASGSTRPVPAHRQHGDLEPLARERRHRVEHRLVLDGGGDEVAPLARRGSGPPPSRPGCPTRWRRSSRRSPRAVAPMRRATSSRASSTASSAFQPKEWLFEAAFPNRSREVREHGLEDARIDRRGRVAVHVDGNPQGPACLQWEWNRIADCVPAWGSIRVSGRVKAGSANPRPTKVLGCPDGYVERTHADPHPNPGRGPHLRRVAWLPDLAASGSTGATTDLGLGSAARRGVRSSPTWSPSAAASSPASRPASTRSSPSPSPSSGPARPASRRQAMRSPASTCSASPSCTRRWAWARRSPARPSAA